MIKIFMIIQGIDELNINIFINEPMNYIRKTISMTKLNIRV